MSQKEKFIQTFKDNYTFKGEEIVLGKAYLGDTVLPEAKVSIPLKTLNRHGLIAGATGTGKTKSLQLMAEGLSKHGVPSLLMDLKGDLSGIAAGGDATNKHIVSRHEALQIPYISEPLPVEFLTLSDEKGARLRATVIEFGPVLFGKILSLTETQSGLMSILFKYCDDRQIPLIDLKDVIKVLQYFQSGEGKEDIEKDYGYMDKRSMGSIIRKIVALQQEGADIFFGEPSFNVNDLLQVKDGLGVVNILRLTDIQSKPALFSTFMLSLLAEVFQEFPEQGDSDKPKLAIFIDEAHLIFKEASKELLSQIESVIKLIRSKGVGIFFCTQVPGDIPDEVLSQLGLKIQHALRGFTAKDRKEIKQAVENYPISEFYDSKTLISELGIGEAFVTALNEKGIPTPLAHTYLTAPCSRMDVLTSKEIGFVIEESILIEKYNTEVDRESAYEILSEKLERNEEANEKESAPKRREGRPKKDVSAFESIMKSSVVRSMGNQLVRSLTRSIFGMLKK